MSTSFFIVAVLTFITFVYIIYTSISDFKKTVKNSNVKRNRIAELEIERLEHLAKIEQIISRYDLLIQEVDHLKSKNIENEKLQDALTRVILGQFHERMLKKRDSHSSSPLSNTSGYLANYMQPISYSGFMTDDDLQYHN